MLRHVTSDKVLQHVSDKNGPVLESEILSWARSCPAATVRLYLKKLVESGKLASRVVAEAGTAFWVPATEEEEENAAEPVSKKAAVEEQQAEVDLDEQIDALAWVDEVYEREVKGHMARLHLYNETKDATQEILGRLANLEGTTVSALYERYGLEKEM